MRKLLIASFLTLAAVSACGISGNYDDLDDAELGMARSALGSNRDWTQADVTAIERELVGEKPSTYRLRLPVFRGTTIVGSREVGTMPVSEVNLIATRLNVTVRGDIPGVAASRMCCGGTLCGAQGGGSGGGNGGGSGVDPLADRLARVLNDLNAGQYQFLF